MCELRSYKLKIHWETLYCTHIRTLNIHKSTQILSKVKIADYVLQSLQRTFLEQMKIWMAKMRELCVTFFSLNLHCKKNIYVEIAYCNWFLNKIAGRLSKKNSILLQMRIPIFHWESHVFSYHFQFLLRSP